MEAYDIYDPPRHPHKYLLTIHYSWAGYAGPDGQGTPSSNNGTITAVIWERDETGTWVEKETRREPRRGLELSINGIAGLLIGYHPQDFIGYKEFHDMHPTANKLDDYEWSDVWITYTRLPSGRIDYIENPDVRKHGLQLHRTSDYPKEK